MYYFSQFADKDVIDVTTGLRLGKSVGIAAGEKLSVAEALIMDTGAVAAYSVFSVNDAVSVDGSVFLSEKREVFDCGKEVYDTTGIRLGKVSDVAFDKSGRVRRIFLEDGTFLPPSRVFACRDVLLVKTRVPRSRTVKAKKQRESESPQKRKCGDFSFLLGRISDKNIVDYQGELLLRKGSAVTREVLKNARQCGKFVELTLHVH